MTLRLTLVISGVLHVFAAWWLLARPLAAVSNFHPVEVRYAMSVAAAPSARVRALQTAVKPVAHMSAESAVPDEGSSSPATTEQPVGQEDVRNHYIREVAALLNAKKRYPPSARRLGQKGQVLVQFRIHRDGKVLSAEVLRKAPHDALNRAAQALIQEISGLKPFPAEIKESTWRFIVPIEYL
jgi:protein TonB